MSIVINTNIPSLAAGRQLSAVARQEGTTISRLASGSRINGASDDAAGLSVAAKMRAQIASTSQAVRNINDAISMAQVYLGACDELEAMFVRGRELATQASTGTYTSEDRVVLQSEYWQLTYEELNRIRSTTEFNRLGVTRDNFTATIEFPGLGRHIMGLNAGDLETVAGARDAIVATDTGLESIAERKSKVGAIINRLEHAVSNLLQKNQNTQSSLSSVADTDYASETATLARVSVLKNAIAAVLAQANQAPQYVLTLLR
jgi:flagellin